MTDQEALRQQLKAMVEKGQRALQASRDHLAKGHTYSKHAGVISGFSEHFVKSGIFPKEFGEAIQKLRRDRELGDYGYQLSVSFEEATGDIQAASEIAEKIQAYLRSHLA